MSFCEDVGECYLSYKRVPKDMHGQSSSLRCLVKHFFHPSQSVCNHSSRKGNSVRGFIIWWRNRKLLAKALPVLYVLIEWKKTKYWMRVWNIIPRSTNPSNSNTWNLLSCLVPCEVLRVQQVKNTTQHICIQCDFSVWILEFIHLWRAENETTFGGAASHNTIK